MTRINTPRLTFEISESFCLRITVAACGATVRRCSGNNSPRKSLGLEPFPRGMVKSGVALNVLVSPDKFKGTLSAQAVAEALARGWKSARAEDHLEMVPMSDGGDGFGQVISCLMGAEPQSVKTRDAAHRPCEAVWWWHEASATAIVESALVIGLAQLPPGKFHPFELDTEGLGEVLLAASRHGARRCVVGIGGSATNDAGFGMAKAIGWQFFNRHEEKIERWTELHALDLVRPPDDGGSALFEELVVAVDVQNPLLGPRGCTRIYGPQKGIRPQDVEFAERCLGQLAMQLTRTLHSNHAEEPGTGAAGGLGYGLRCFAGARLEPGFGLFAQAAGLAERLDKADLVLTGEGAIDEQTLMGKGVGELAALCRQHQAQCLGFAGVVTDPEKARSVFTQTHALTPNFVPKEEAFTRTAACLERLATSAAQAWKEY